MPKFNKNQVSLKEAYAFYKKSLEAKGIKPLTYKEYKLILDTWGNRVVEYLVEGRDVKLHHGLSVIGVRKRRKAWYPDRAASKEAGELVKRSNVHSGFYGAYVWWRRHYTRFSSVGWVFKPSRLLQRSLGKVMLERGGHTNFTMRAVTPATQEQAISTYNKKVHKI